MQCVLKVPLAMQLAEAPCGKGAKSSRGKYKKVHRMYVHLAGRGVGTSVADDTINRGDEADEQERSAETNRRGRPLPRISTERNFSRRETTRRWSHRSQSNSRLVAIVSESLDAGRQSVESVRSVSALRIRWGLSRTLTFESPLLSAIARRYYGIKRPRRGCTWSRRAPGTW